VGDLVRVSHLKSLFDREYQQKWSGEVYKVVGRYMREGIAVYKLTDYADEPITGTFYNDELQAVHVDENTTFKIEKIIRRRTRGRRKEALVRWLHWAPKFDSWIPLASVKDYAKQKKS
jgi:hypothetical protein